MRRIEAQTGQSLSEAVILMPFFLLLMFMIMQAAHLGMAVAIVNYGASAIARQSVQRNQFDHAAAQEKFHTFMIAGLNDVKIESVNFDNSDTIAPNITISACARMTAYPLVGPFLSKTIKSGGDTSCGGEKAFGPVSITSRAPYRFFIHGQAVARMNYNSHS